MVQRQSDSLGASPLQHDRNATDRRCIGRIVTGDVESLGDLYDRHATAMYSLALRILDRDTDAKDVVCEVFAHVWREAGHDEASRGIVAVWLLTLTRDRAVDRLRAMRARAELHAIGDRAGRTRSATAVRAEEVLAADAPQRAGEALRTLPDLERTVIEMAYFEGLDEREIADRLEQPLDTVKTCLRVALVTLRAARTGDVR